MNPEHVLKGLSKDERDALARYLVRGGHTNATMYEHTTEARFIETHRGADSMTAEYAAVVLQAMGWKHVDSDTWRRPLGPAEADIVVQQLQEELAFHQTHSFDDSVSALEGAIKTLEVYL